MLVWAAFVVFVLLQHQFLRIFDTIGFQPRKYANQDHQQMRERFLHIFIVSKQRDLRTRRHHVQHGYEFWQGLSFQAFPRFGRFIGRADYRVKIFVRFQIDRIADEIQDAQTAV